MNLYQVNKNCPLENIILVFKITKVRESIPKQVDKKSWVPKEEKGVWGPRRGDRGLEFLRRKGQMSFFFYFLHSLVLVT